MSTQIRVDLAAPTPPYEQIRSQVASLIAVGTLAAGQRLPPVRSLAADLGVAAGTVARAYKELEAAGLLISRRRHGTTVAETAGAGRKTAAGSAEVSAAVVHMIHAARDAGLDDETVMNLVRGQLQHPHGTAPAAP
ncbi:GntR family transcriptional regulator [Arthrobacter sulfonylureivorans]|uniref:GntR family transcriptional regulator n=1 Tax=Arthrobacter sulfonylureivorans TaxID=2486855 RepID=UPI0039E32E80